jgi:hypothetical protein
MPKLPKSEGIWFHVSCFYLNKGFFGDLIAESYEIQVNKWFAESSYGRIDFQITSRRNIDWNLNF